MHRFNAQRGDALVLALLLSVALLAVGSLLSILTQLQSQRSAVYHRILRAKGLAEAGAARALWRIHTDTAPPREVQGEVEGVGGYQATVQPEDGAFLIRAVGQTSGLPSLKSHLRAKITFSFPEAFETAVYSVEPVTLSNSRVEGRVISKGEAFSQSPEGGELVREPVGLIPPFPLFNHAVYNRLLRRWNQQLTGAQGGPSAGMATRVEWRDLEQVRWGKERLITIHGDLRVRLPDGSAAIEGPGTVLVTGSMEIRGRTQFRDVTLIVQQELTLMDDVHVDSATCYATAIDLKDQARCSGTLFAQKRIRCVGRTSIHPASLLFLGINEPRQEKQIRIEDQAQVEGTVLSSLGTRREAPSEGPTLTTLTEPRLISIGREATVRGVIFTDGMVDLQGTVLGSVVARRFREGRIDGARIDRYRMPSDLRVPRGFRVNRRRPKLLVWTHQS